VIGRERLLGDEVLARDMGKGKLTVFSRGSFRFLYVAVLICALGTPGWSVQAASPRDLGYALKSISSRPNMVSGGDVLVEATAPARVLGSIAMFLNGRDVASAFRASFTAGILIGHIEGLDTGKNTLEMRSGGKRRAAIELTNHPISGPIFSGPHQEPFFCQTEAAGLGPALDKGCDAKTHVAYFYKSTAPENPGDVDIAELAKTLSPDERNCLVSPCALFRYLGFKNYDPAGPRPTDIAQTRTSEGHLVDFIVRRERGTINRAIYDIYFLHRPGERLPNPWSRTPGWNGRLVYNFGGGCDDGGGHHQGLLMLPSPNPLAILGQGYALASSSLTIGRNNCNDVISAETVAMVKERFIKQFGVPVHTIGWGASGGSIQQYLVAQNYPGLLDGIIPMSSFPDALTVVSPTTECLLLDRVFNTSRMVWTNEQKAVVSGYASWAVCSGDKSRGAGGWMSEIFWVSPAHCDSSVEKAIPGDMIYDRADNPHGLRCDLFDNQINVWGHDPATGFARRALDNVGVQYGLAAINAGKINVEQFLDLNERIGGFDNDGEAVSSRTVANTDALRIAYKTGRVNSGSGGLSSVPIIDVRTYTEGQADIHDSVRSLVVRARLLAANGRADNQVILTFPFTSWSAAELQPNSLLFTQEREVLRQMDIWLDNISLDSAPGTNLEKIARNKPRALVDACWTPDGAKIAESPTMTGPGQCHDLYPPHGDVRLASGTPLAGNVLKCALKPVAREDYGQSLTAEQLERLKRIFPRGVCDYSRPGVMQSASAQTWQAY
jgi:Tannase-like family of unknown function (DUF6351)